jgi:hypothetical protein
MACSAMAARGDLLQRFSSSTGTVFRAALIEMMVTRDLPRERMIQHTHDLRALLIRNTAALLRRFPD